MRRISVFEISGRWTFAPGSPPLADWANALDAGNAAVVYGNSLRASNAGFVIRLLLPTPNPTDSDNVVIYTHVFSRGSAMVSGS